MEMWNSCTDKIIVISLANNMILRKKPPLFGHLFCHKLEKCRVDFFQDYPKTICFNLIHLCPSMLLFCFAVVLLCYSTVLSCYYNVSFYFLGWISLPEVVSFGLYIKSSGSLLEANGFLFFFVFFSLQFFLTSGLEFVSGISFIYS